MYGDDVTQSDIDSAVDRAKSDLDYDLRRLGDDLRGDIRNLEREIAGLRSRISALESYQSERG